MVQFFTAFILSAFGYEFIFFVMTLYVYEMSQNAFKVGIFAALTLIPRLFASFYGVIIDRYDRPKVLAAVSCIVGFLMISMVFAASLTAIYVLWTLAAIFLTVMITTRTALMTEIMAQDGFLRGNSIVLLCLNIAKVCAPFIAGVAGTFLSIHVLFYFTGGLYFSVAFIASRICLTGASPRKKRKNILAELNEGIGYMRRNPNVKYLLTIGILWRLFVGLQISLFVVYIKAFLGGSDAEYGLFMTIIGVGSILGSLVGPWLVKRLSYSVLIFGGLSVHYACFTLLGLLHDFVAALGVAFTGYFVFYAALVGLHSLRDQAVCTEMRGRVYGSVTSVLTPPAIFSMLAGGYLTDWFGVDNVLMSAGFLAMSSFFLLSWRQKFFFSSNRQVCKEGVS